MINLVIGKINSGKSKFLEHHYAKHQAGDGYVARKIIDDGNVIGFQALRLATGETRMWMIHERFYRQDFIRHGQIGPYYFNRDLFDEIVETMKSLIEQGVAPLYVDEVGQLELDGGGFDGTMRLLVEKNVECYVSVRRHLIGLVVDRYRLDEYRLIDVEEQ